MKTKLKLSRKAQKVCKIVREEAERLVKNGNHGNTYGNVLSLGGACGDVSAILWEALVSVGVEAYFEGGQFDFEGHCWVRLSDDSVLDLTATQFGRYPKVYHSKNKKYRVTYQSSNKKAIGAEINNWAHNGWRAALRRAVMKRLE